MQMVRPRLDRNDLLVSTFFGGLTKKQLKQCIEKIKSDIRADVEEKRAREVAQREKVERMREAIKQSDTDPNNLG